MELKLTSAETRPSNRRRIVLGATAAVLVCGGALAAEAAVGDFDVGGFLRLLQQEIADDTDQGGDVGRGGGGDSWEAAREPVVPLPDHGPPRRAAMQPAAERGAALSGLRGADEQAGQGATGPSTGLDAPLIEAFASPAEPDPGRFSATLTDPPDAIVGIGQGLNTGGGVGHHAAGPPDDSATGDPSGGDSGAPQPTSGDPGPTAGAAGGVPEPATWISLTLGFGLLGMTRRRRRAFG